MSTVFPISGCSIFHFLFVTDTKFTQQSNRTQQSNKERLHPSVNLQSEPSVSVRTYGAFPFKRQTSSFDNLHSINRERLHSRSTGAINTFLTRDARARQPRGSDATRRQQREAMIRAPFTHPARGDSGTSRADSTRVTRRYGDRRSCGSDTKLKELERFLIISREFLHRFYSTL
jgi:hypothetical protein